MEFDEDVPQLKMDGRNWSAWHESVTMVINKAGLYSYVDGTVSEPDRQLEAMAKLILTIGLPDSIFRSMLYLKTAHNYYKYLTNRFDKSTVQPLQERLRKIEGCCDAEPQVAVRTQKTFDGACRKCGERGHKARECGKVRVESGSVEVEVGESVKECRVHEHIDDEANSVDIIPTDETGTRETASASTDANAQEQGGKEVEAEVSNNEPSVPDTNGDESRRPGNPTDPPHDAEEAARQTGKLELLTTRPGDIEVKPGGGIIPERNESVTLESADAKADGKVLGTHRDVQVEVKDARTQGNVSIKGARARATTHARSMTTADENDQYHAVAVDNAPDKPPTPPAPPNEPTQRYNQSPSVELEEERRAASSCDVEHTMGKTETSGVLDSAEDDWNQSMKLRNTSERVSKSSKQKGRKHSPGWAQVEPGDPSSEADASRASGRAEETREKLEKLENASERVSELSERKGREDSPREPQVELGDPGYDADASAVSLSVGDVGKSLKKLRKPSKRVNERSERMEGGNSLWGHPDEQSDPDDEAAAPGDVHSDPECHRGKTNERVVETNASRRDKGPRGHMGELERSRSVEGDWDRQTDVEDVGYDQD